MSSTKRKRTASITPPPLISEGSNPPSKEEHGSDQPMSTDPPSQEGVTGTSEQKPAKVHKQQQQHPSSSDDEEGGSCGEGGSSDDDLMVESISQEPAPKKRKTRKIGERAIVNTRVMQFCKQSGVRSAKTGKTIERWLKTNLRMFEVEGPTCFDGDTKHLFDTDVTVNYTFVATHFPDVSTPKKELIHRRMQNLIRESLSTSCQLCLNQRKQTLSPLILFPVLDSNMARMCCTNVREPQQPIIIKKYKTKAKSKDGPGPMEESTDGMLEIVEGAK